MCDNFTAGIQIKSHPNLEQRSNSFSLIHRNWKIQKNRLSKSIPSARATTKGAASCVVTSRAISISCSSSSGGGGERLRDRDRDRDAELVPVPTRREVMLLSNPFRKKSLSEHP